MFTRLLASTFLCLSFATGCLAQDVEPSDEAADESIAADQQDLSSGGGTCGPNVCSFGTYCCNASCGICAPKGDLCTQQFCDNGL
jgi:hypothetical protein